MKSISPLLLAGAYIFLSACAHAPRPPLGSELVVVLPGHDGNVGGVIVRRDGAEQVLDQPYAAARIVSGGTPKTEKLTAADVKNIFGPALLVLPGKPASFLVYFQEGTDELTVPSIAELKNVFNEIKNRPEPDLMVIGHTDNVGGDVFNDKLSLARADRIRDMLMGLGIPAARIQVAGRGKRESLVHTQNNVSEPRNRRVEISVR